MKSVTRFSLSLLSVCILSSMLAACGGGGDGDAAGNSNQENPTPLEIPQQPPVGNVANPYPEPTQDVINQSALGFYDYNANSESREVRNDLEGDFQAMIQFAQGHVVDPNGNEAKKMPRLTAKKRSIIIGYTKSGHGQYRHFAA